MDKDLNKEIEEMAEVMEKSSQEPKERLFALIKSLGPQGLKSKLDELSDEEKKVLKAALEEMTLKKAVEFDKEARGAKMIQGKVVDTIIQEDIASDDADEKLVKPEAAKMNHQGTPTDGWEGQVIKGQETLEKKQGVPKGVDPVKQESCVKDLKHKKGIDNPYAVCNVSMKKGGVGSGKKGHTTLFSGRIPGAASHSLTVTHDPKAGNYHAWHQDSTGRSKYHKITPNEDGNEYRTAPHETAHANIENIIHQHKQGMKKSEVVEQLEKSEEALDQFVSKMMEKAEEAIVLEKCAGMGMDMKKVQGAVDKYKKKKKQEVEKAMNKDSEKDKAKNKLMAMEEKEHGIKNPKKLVDAEKKEHKMEKAKMNKEEDQLGDAPEMEGKTMGKKEAAPDIEDNAKASKKAQKDVKNTKVKKCEWEDQNHLLKANIQGRNFHFEVGEYLEKSQTQKETEGETLKKSEGEKEDLNDLIAKSMDRNWDQVRDERALEETEKKQKTGTLVKSFNETTDLTTILGLTEEEAKQILG